MRQKTVLFIWALFVVACWKLSLRGSFGAHFVSFSCLSVVLPLIGAFLRARTSSAWSMGAWGLAHLTHLPITMGLPTYFATLSWSASSQKAKVALHVLLPLSCMLLFCLAAEKGSWPYALYWLIPVFLHFFPRAVICSALQSTFVAHAVGSVMWVLFVPMASSAWIGLIPVVAIERLAMASMGALIVGMLKMTEGFSFSVQSERIR